MDFDSPVGKGVVGKVGAAKSRSAMRISSRNATDALAAKAEELRLSGATAIFRRHQSVGREHHRHCRSHQATTPDAIRALQTSGVKVIMLTGDNQVTAEAIAWRLKLADVKADVLPDQKSAVVADLRAHGRRGCRYRHGDRHQCCDRKRWRHRSERRSDRHSSRHAPQPRGHEHIRQNLFFAFVYNAAGIPIAAGALYPLFCTLLSPMITAAAMAASSVSVIWQRAPAQGHQGLRRNA